MPPLHRNGDLRWCGAATNAGTSSVYANGILVSVQGDGNTHLAGSLAASNTSNIYAEGKKVVLVGSVAAPDLKCPPVPPNIHCNPGAGTGSSDVFGHG